MANCQQPRHAKCCFDTADKLHARGKFMASHCGCTAKTLHEHGFMTAIPGHSENTASAPRAKLAKRVQNLPITPATNRAWHRFTGRAIGRDMLLPSLFKGLPCVGQVRRGCPDIGQIGQPYRPFNLMAGTDRHGFNREAADLLTFPHFISFKYAD
jgi:hypothetical protein